jgi:hypothetical protein
VRPTNVFLSDLESNTLKCRRNADKSGNVGDPRDTFESNLVNTVDSEWRIYGIIGKEVIILYSLGFWIR